MEYYDKREILEFMKDKELGYNFGIEISLTDERTDDYYDYDECDPDECECEKPLDGEFMIISDGELGKELFNLLLGCENEYIQQLSQIHIDLSNLINEIVWDYENTSEIREHLLNDENLIFKIGKFRKL